MEQHSPIGASADPPPPISIAASDSFHTAASSVTGMSITGISDSGSETSGTVDFDEINDSNRSNLIGVQLNSSGFSLALAQWPQDSIERPSIPSIPSEFPLEPPRAPSPPSSNETTNDAIPNQRRQRLRTDSAGPRLSLVAAPGAPDGRPLELVCVYAASVLYDYLPAPAPTDTDAAATTTAPIPLRAGEAVSVFGTIPVGFTDTVTGEFWRSDLADRPLDVLADVNVSGGWCHVERADRISGFAPISFLKFETQDSASNVIPERINLNSSEHSFVIDPKPYNRLSSTHYITSFPAPPADPGADAFLPSDLGLSLASSGASGGLGGRPDGPGLIIGTRGIATAIDDGSSPSAAAAAISAASGSRRVGGLAGLADFVRSPARVGASIQSAWSALVSPTSAAAAAAGFVGPGATAAAAVREFVLHGSLAHSPAAAAQAGRQRVQSTVSLITNTASVDPAAAASSANDLNSAAHTSFTIEPRGNNVMNWRPRIAPLYVDIHSPQRRRRVAAATDAAATESGLGSPGSNSSNPSTTANGSSRRNSLGLTASSNMSISSILPRRAAEEYIVYKITTRFSAKQSGSTLGPTYNTSSSTQEETSITVERRYNDFCFLYTYLHASFPPGTLVTLPPQLPPKHLFASRFNPSHVQERMRGLQLFLDQIVRHPILRSEEIVISFLNSGGVEEDASGSMTTQWALDEASPVSAVADGLWRRGYEIPRASSHKQVLTSTSSSNNAAMAVPIVFHHIAPAPQTVAHESLASNFFEHVVIPPSARYTGLSMSTFRLRTVESISENLLARLQPLVDAATRHEAQNQEAQRITLDIAHALQATGRLLSSTGNDQPGCWVPTCQSCGPIGNAMITASLQLKHVAEIHGAHGARSARRFAQHLAHMRAMLGPVRMLTHMQHAATMAVSEAIQEDPDRGHPSSAISPILSPSMLSPHSAGRLPHSPLAHDITTPFASQLLSPSTSVAQRFHSNQYHQHQQHHHHQHHHIQEAEHRAAVVLAVAESESVHAHTEKTLALETAMASWLDDEIDKHERILKRLRAAKEVFRGPNSRI